MADIQRIDLVQLANSIKLITEARNFDRLDARTIRTLVAAHGELIGELRDPTWPKDPRREM